MLRRPQRTEAAQRLEARTARTVDALIRADRALHSEPLHQRHDRGIQQQNQADPTHGV